MNTHPNRSRTDKTEIFPSLCILLVALLLVQLFFSSQLCAKTVLKVGVYNNKPTIFVNEPGKVQGLFIDILEDIALQQDWEIEYVVGHFSEVFDSLKADSFFLHKLKGFTRFFTSWIVINCNHKK